MLKAIGMTVTIASGVLGNTIKNRFAKDNLKTGSDNTLYNLIVSIICAVIMALGALIVPSAGSPFRVSGYTLLLAVCFSVLTAGAQLSSTVAFRHGPMALTTLITLCGMLVSTTFGTVVWHETVTVWQITGIVLMLISLVLVLNPKLNRQVTVTWVILSLVAMLFNGSLGVMQKIHGMSDFADEKMGFLFYTFVFTSVLMAGMLLVDRCRGKHCTIRVGGRIGLSAVAVGITTALQNIINLFLVAVMQSAVFFPICNGTRILLLGLIGSLLFHEKMSKKQTFGFFLGLISVMLVAGVMTLFG